MGNTHQGRDTLDTNLVLGQQNIGYGDKVRMFQGRNWSFAINSNGSDNGDPHLTANQSAPILFHATHSASLQLSLTRRLVKRFDSCKGICFTSRPIDIGERIYVRIVESSNSWKGALRFGFTCDDPSSINASDLPKFACPDLTFEQGYWAKAVPESIVRQGYILFFYLNHDGRVIFGVNGEARGQLFSGVKTDILLWALMDVYGNTTAIELVDVLQLSTTSLNSGSSNSSSEQRPPASNLPGAPPSSKSTPRTASLPPGASKNRRTGSPPPGSSSSNPGRGVGHPPPVDPGYPGSSTPPPVQRHVEGTWICPETRPTPAVIIGSLGVRKGIRPVQKPGSKQSAMRTTVKGSSVGADPGYTTTCQPWTKAPMAANGLLLCKQGMWSQNGCAYLRSLSRPDRPAADANNVTAVTEGRSSERRIVEVIRPMAFHYTIGRNITLSANRTVATRLPQEYCNGYVFTAEPLLPGERLILTVLKVDVTFCGGLAFGMTSCDPANVRLVDLTDDSDLLLDRPEYWVVRKDVCTKAAVNDELCLHLTERGEVRYSRNGRNAGVLMHVDCSLPLWAFIDVYGTTQEIQCRGVARRSKHRPTSRQLSSPSASSSDAPPLPDLPPLHSLPLAAFSQSSPAAGEVANSSSTNRRPHHHHHHGSRSANATPSPSVIAGAGEQSDALTQGAGFQIGAMPLNAITPFLGVHQRACLLRNGASQPGGLGGPPLQLGAAPLGSGGVAVGTGGHGGNRNDWATPSGASQGRRRASNFVPQSAEMGGGWLDSAGGAALQGGRRRHGQDGGVATVGRPLDAAARVSQHASAPSFQGVDFFNSAPMATLPAPLIPVPSSTGVPPTSAAAALPPAAASPPSADVAASISPASVVVSQEALNNSALPIVGQSSNGVAPAVRPRPRNVGTSAVVVQHSSDLAQSSSHRHAGAIGPNSADITADRYGPLAALSLESATTNFSDFSNFPAAEPLVDLSSPITAKPSDWLGGNAAANSSSECVVCLERPADSALYTCGHMCMCYACAQGLVRSKKPLCPICRQPIQDVIKIFRS